MPSINRGQVVIDFEFDGASNFSEGLAPVFYKNKVGCIDQATSKDEAEQGLSSLEEKWTKKYPVVFDSWKHNSL